MDEILVELRKQTRILQTIESRLEDKNRVDIKSIFQKAQDYQRKSLTKLRG